MSDHIELEPTFDNYDGTVTSEGDEVFLCGIGDRILGIGTFAGSLVLAEVDGNEIHHPIIEVQGELVSGGQVDLWSTDPSLIEQHRDAETYPIDLYLAEVRAAEARIISLVDGAYANELGVILD